MKSLLAVVAVVAAVLPSGADAANLPDQFNGLWVAAEVPNKDKCRKEEPKGEDDRPVDSMMSVAPGTITYYEQHCQIVSAKRLQAPNPNEQGRINVDVNLACKGEGMLWSAREIWHVETIDGNKVVVVTGLSQTNFRDERGRKQNTPSMITTSIYYACK
ncbi:MAG: hypothetical protein QOG38_813 [Hyphomicrobiales bacterium]|jgi:hypothetical protein|nr:hypothetical protein [Hyphomicrobiales bacterium]